jgi:hypothetical protein
MSRAVTLASVAKLLPLLGSDQDGEVLATVRAIARKLRAAGLDLNDLAQALTAPPSPPPRWPPFAEPPGPVRSKLAVIAVRQLVKAIRTSPKFGTLSPFELSMLDTIDALSGQGIALTLQQEKNLLELHRKMLTGGVKL